MSEASVHDIHAIESDDQAFSDLVASEARGEVDERVAAWLRTPEIAPLWARALGDIVRGMIHQSLGLTEDDAFDLVAVNAGQMTMAEVQQHRAERASTRRRMARFKRGIETRLSEAKRIVREDNIRRSQDENQQMRVMYREAIKAHRAATLADGLDPSEFDIDLWAVLEVLPA